jgi:peptide/nickel transport system permease protein
MARPYVLAAQLAGASRLAIALGHVLPGIAPTLLVMVAFFFGDALITESALTFLGLGAPFDAPTWGNMLQEGRLRMLQAPWLMLVPAGCIVVTVLAANLLGDGIAARARRNRHSFAL